MSDFEFVIPLQKDELLESHVGQYHVEDVVHQRVLTAKLQEAVRSYNTKGVDFVFEHFDTYFSILVHGNKLEWATINKGFEYVERACQQLCGHLETLFQDKELSQDTRVRSLNCLKMLLYLHTSLIKVKDSKLKAEMAASLTIGKKGRKAAAAEGSEKDGEWREAERRSALDVLYNLLQLSLHRLWDPPLADDAFVDMVAQPCYSAIEDVSIKNKTNRETVFQVLGVLNKKYNHGLSCTIKLVQIVQLYEHAVPGICAGVAQLVTTWGLGGMVARLVRELGESLGGGGADDENAAVGIESAPAQRNCAQLLTELTQLLPSHMIPAAQSMRSYLETDDCYPLRCSVLGMLCEILCRELKGEGLSEEKRAMRDDFLDDLEEHLHDVTAYVRSRSLQYWCRLQREGCIPVTRHQRVLSKAIGRLQDRATLVRKNAVQLLKIFLEHNPFSAQLKLEILEEQLAVEKKCLEAMHLRLNPEPDAELVKKWGEMEKLIEEVIKSKLNQLTQDDPPLSQGTVNDAYANIRKHLHSENYFDAFMLIRHAERQYPEAKLLRCEMDKKDQVSYFIALLKNVFVTDISNNQETERTDIDDAQLIASIDEKDNIVAFLEESVSFSRLIQQAVPLVYTLLMSKQGTDVFEAIEFFTTAHSFNIESAKIGIMGMLQLVWSPDQDKRDAVERAYKQMYLSSDLTLERARACATAKKLLTLIELANRGHAAALQTLLGRWIEAQDIGAPLIQVLWEIFTKKHEEATDDDSYAALSLLVMMSKAKPSIASANLEVLQTVGLSGPHKIRMLSIQMLLTLGKVQQRIPSDNPLLRCLSERLIESFFTMSEFSDLGTSAINAIYVLCETPDLMCIQLLKNITDKMNSKNKDTLDADSDVASYPAEHLSRLLVLFGQIAVQQLIYLDVTVYGELRRRNEIREQRKVANVKSKVQLAPLGRKSRVAELALNSSSASASSRLRANNTTVQEGAEENEDEAGLDGAVADDADAELVRAVCESGIVSESDNSHMLLGKVTPWLHSLLTSSSQTSPRLTAAACLTLARFMLVSSSYCEDNMQLLMTMLKKSSCSKIRCNIVISLADLTLRFPNVIQPWTHYIYERLEDSYVEVRQCTVKMLSFLILQEMVRVRGQVAALARCCVDDDSHVRTMARLFFKQLAQKGNSLYNVIPDIISRLSDPALQLQEDHFRTILKYVMSLIQKDRQMEALVEKLCLRFKLSIDERQWRDLAYCLSLFTYNERSVKKLIENMDCYKDKLYSKEVYDCFKNIITNSNKNAKADLKAAVTELSDKIEECFKVQEAGSVAGVGDNPPELPRGRTPGKIKKPAGRRNKPRRSNSDESGSDSNSDNENQTPSQKNTQNRNIRNSARKRAPPKYLQENGSDDSDNEEDFQMTKAAPAKKELFKKPTGRVGRKRK